MKQPVQNKLIKLSSNLLIMIFSTVKMTSPKATVPKAAQCVDNLDQCGQGFCVPGLLVTEKVHYVPERRTISFTVHLNLLDSAW